MSVKRFVQMKEFNGFSDICDNGEFICSVRVEYAPKLVGLLNEQQVIINKQERRIMVLENLLTNMGVKWVDDDE